MKDWMNRFKNEYRKKCGQSPARPGFPLMMDCLSEQFLYGVSPEEYFRYEFYKISRAKRRDYAAGRKIWRFFDHMNPPKKWDDLTDKARFHEVYSTVTGREALFAATAGFDEFQAFVHKHPRFFAKPYDGTFGMGVRIVSCGSDEEMREEYERLRREQYLIEELIDQCAELKAFHPPSLNTIRLHTIVTKAGTAEAFPYASLRFGRGGHIADNFTCQSGLTCMYESDSGLITTPAVDSMGNRYDYHPDTHLKIVGFQIPAWNEVLAVAKKAALIRPALRMVGWDVGINADYAPVIIEGNPRPDPISVQSDLTGRWSLFQQYI